MPAPKPIDRYPDLVVLARLDRTPGADTWAPARLVDHRWAVTRDRAGRVRAVEHPGRSEHDRSGDVMVIWADGSTTYLIDMLYGAGVERRVGGRGLERIHYYRAARIADCPIAPQLQLFPGAAA